ncbi:unnamed protein product [Mytilus edulis]|uniref:B box-type domain-containing protein n=1 Tax=Mytilus edulis TaxID=6550 RepID=A0A8S3T2D0_MYTED|nr:unnamed protein product [Mytilus edulis]
MASVHNFCHLCEEEDVSNVAVVWCADCENFLCKDCEKHHGRSKASKDHQTISQDEYKKLPSFIVGIKNRCEKHDQKYVFYCKFHGDPCCVRCITDNHKDCRDLDSLVEVLRDIKTSAKVSNLDKELDILLENFDTVVKYLNSRIATIKKNKTESLREIRNLRALINKHLDEIEKKIVDDLSEEFKKIKLTSDNLSSEIEDKKKVNNKVITKTIEVADVCYGIDSNGDTLVVKLIGSRKKLLTLDLEGSILSEIRVPGEFTFRIALHKDNIVVTDWKANLISCYTNNGVLVWTYKHEDIREPFGITVDKNGFIYVACKGNDKIVVLSEDGKTSKTILSKVDGIVNPLAINIDKTSSTLLVTNASNGKAYLFDI